MKAIASFSLDIFHLELPCQRTRPVYNYTIISIAIETSYLLAMRIARFGLSTMKKQLKTITNLRGYEIIYDPQNPLAQSFGYVLKHRQVMKKELLKFPDPTKMHVHHKDGNKLNNKKSNLMVVDSRTHHRLEKGWQLIKDKWFKICQKCKILLEVNQVNFYKRKTPSHGLNDEYFHCCKSCARKIIIEKNRQKGIKQRIFMNGRKSV